MQRNGRFSLSAVQGRLAQWRRSHSSLIMQATAAPLRRDMVTVLTFVRDNKIIGTSVAGNMPLKVVGEVAPLLSTPPKLETRIGDRTYQCRSEQEVWPLYILHILAEVGRLMQTGRSRRWKLTTQGRQFLDTEPDIQLAFTVAVWWLHVNWLVAYPFEGMGEELPRGFSASALMQLHSLPAGVDIAFDEFAHQLIDSTGLIWRAPDSSVGDIMLRSSIERMIIDVLATCGALICTYTTETSSGIRENALTTIHLTPLGRALVEAVTLLCDLDFA
jgi:hypothetical protein